MAPVRPVSKAKRSSTTKPQRTTFPAKQPTEDSLFNTSKRDKREMKHSLLLSKVRKSSGVSKNLKRRRPSKKLVTTLEGLEDALPVLLADKTNASKFEEEQSKILSTKPGSRKKREKLEREERARFGKNLAVLSMARPSAKEVEGGAEQHNNTRNRWATLRAHIQQSMGEHTDASRD